MALVKPALWYVVQMTGKCTKMFTITISTAYFSITPSFHETSNLLYIHTLIEGDLQRKMPVIDCYRLTSLHGYCRRKIRK